MEDPSGKNLSEPHRCEKPTLADLWALKGCFTELFFVAVLLFASLGSDELKTILGLSIAVTVMACILILLDVREISKKRDFRKSILGLLFLDIIVLIVSSIVLHHWILNEDGKIGDENVPTYYALDGVMLILMIFICSARLALRARDRRIQEAEAGVLMRNVGVTSTRGNLV